MLVHAKPVEAGAHSIRWKIAASGNSIRSFAEKSGVPRSTLVLAIDGANIVPQTAKKIADALGMWTDELFDFDE